MNDYLDKFAKKLQDKIDKEDEKIYSKKVIQEYKNPKHYGVIDNPDTIGEIKGPCGDTMRISLKISDDIIEKARFQTDGCGPSLACGNMLMKLIEGKAITDALTITDKQLLNALNGLPKEHEHCAVLAVNTLKQSLNVINKENKQSTMTQ